MITAKTAFWKWAIVGLVVASVLLIAQSAAVGGMLGLLQVGEISQLRGLIEAELGPVPLFPGLGHDGQIYYAIGLDLVGEQVPELLDHAAYRYRRILFPLISSAFGTLQGKPLLWGMVLLTVVSTAVASGTIAALARKYGGSDWTALVVLANPGVWLSVRLLSADTLALALMIGGVYTVLAGARSSLIAFSGSVLAKDAYVVTPAGLGVEGKGRRWVVGAIPVGVLVLWMGWLTLTMGDGFSGRGNLALPFMGLVEGARNWAHLGFEEWFYLAFAIGSVLAGLFYSATASRPLRWSIMAWAVLGVISSDWVWDFGNNAARVFAPIAVLVAVSRLGISRDVDVDDAVAVA